jgi:hypothetical protein
MAQTTFGTSDPVWKEVTDYPQYLISRTGEIKNKKSGHILAQYLSNGYKKVNLRNENGMKGVRVHRLAATAWLPTPAQERNQVNHIDGNKINNCVENLEWCSAKENMAHFRQTHPVSLPSVQLRFSKEGEEPKTFKSISVAAKHFNKSLSTIWGASLNGRWNGYKVERIQPNTETQQTAETQPEIQPTPEIQQNPLMSIFTQNTEMSAETQ